MLNETRNVGLQAKIKFAKHMEPRPLWKLFCWATFTEDFCEVHATMEESNREVGIISSDSYYFFHLIKVKEKSYVRKLKDLTFFKGATSWFAYLEKGSLAFSSSWFEVLVNRCHPYRSSLGFDLFLPQVFSTLEHDHFKVLVYLRALQPSKWLIIVT